MRKYRHSLTAAACALAVSVVSLPASASPPKVKVEKRSASGPTSVKAPKRATQKGRDLFSAVFFDVGPYSGKLDEFHDGNKAALRVARKARVDRDPKKMLKLARYLESQGDKKGAAAARSAAEVFKHFAKGKIAPAKARKLLLDTIEKQDPGFFPRFAQLITSGKPTKVDKALTEAGHATIKALEKIQKENVPIGNVQVGPQPAVELVVVIVVVVVLAVAVVHVAIDKDSPDEVKPMCMPEPDKNECVEEFRTPSSVLRRKELAKLISTRLAGV